MPEYGYIWERRQQSRRHIWELKRKVRLPVKHPGKVAAMVLVPLTLLVLLIWLIVWVVRSVSQMEGPDLMPILVILILLKMSSYKLGKRVVAYKAARAMRKTTWDSMKNY